MKRIVDIAILVSAQILFTPLFLIFAIAVRLTLKGFIYFVSDRIGANNSNFNMLRFRILRSDTLQMATHLMTAPKIFLAPISEFLRKSNFDELSQLIKPIK